jgi:hypothetical protein
LMPRYGGNFEPIKCRSFFGMSMRNQRQQHSTKRNLQPHD